MHNDVVHKEEVVVTADDAKRLGELAPRLVHRMIQEAGDRILRSRACGR